MATRAGVVLAVVVLASLLPFVRGSGLPDVSAAPPPVLRIGFLQSFDSLNPYQGVTDAAFVLYGLLYDNPFTFDQDGNRVPNLITSSSCATADCSAWNYTVRQGVYWNDPANPAAHVQLTAADVNFTWNYDSQHLTYLWAYEPYFNRVVQCTPSNVGHCGAVISATNPWNVTLFFDRPFVAGNDLMAPIVEAAQWSAISPASASTSFTNADPIGTGPFIADPNIYTEFQSMPTVPLHLTRNPAYHPIGSTTPVINVSDLYLYEFTDPTSMALALEGGSIDVAQFTPSTIGPLLGYPNVVVQSALQAIQEWNYVGFSQCDNTAADSSLNPARWDSSVRHALARATNKDYIVQNLYNGQGVPGSSLVSPITPQWWYDPVAGGDNLTFSLTQAASILDGDGWTGTWSDSTGTYRLNPSPIDVSFQSSAGALDVENITNTTKTIPAGTHLQFTLAVRPPSTYPEEYLTAQYLQAEWAQIGVKVVIKAETTEGSLATDVYGCKVDAYIWFWSGDPDPNYLLSMQSSWTLDGWNDNFWVNTSYNRLYLAQLADLSPTQRIADVQAAEKIQYEAAPDLIYIYPYGEWAMRTDLWQGWGDWSAHPYRQLNAYWGANPLFFGLTCPTCGNVTPQNFPPTIPTIQPNGTITTYAHVNLTFTATTSDPETTDVLTFNWSWGDGTSTETTTNASTPQSTASHAWATAASYQVEVAVSDGYTPFVSSYPVTVDVLAPPPSPGWLAGNVTNSITKLPIAGAILLASPEGGTTVATATDAQGRYNLTLPAGTCNVQASAPFYNVSTVIGVTVLAGQTTLLFFSLAPTQAPVQVSLHGGTGRPGVPIAIAGSIEGGMTGNWTLHFGDGNAASGAFGPGTTFLSFNHTYTVEGNLTASLFVQAGNYTAVTDATVLVDGTPPVTTASVSGTSGRLGWFVSAVTVRLSASDALSGVAFTVFRIGGGAWQAYTGPVPLAAQGTTIVRFYSADWSGNVEATKSITVSEDSAAPVVSITRPSASSTLTSSSVEVTWTASDSVSGVASTQISVDNGTFTNVTGLSTTLQGLADGSHTVVLRVTDVAGNVATSSVTFTVQAGLFGGLSTVVISAIAAVIIVAAVGFAMLLRWRKNRSPPPRGGAPPPGPPQG